MTMSTIFQRHNHGIVVRSHYRASSVNVLRCITWIASVGWFSLKSMLELSILVFSFSIELCSVFSVPLDLLILKSTFLQVSRKTILYSKRMFLLLLSCHHHQRHQLCVASWFLSEAMSKKNSHLFFFSISFNYGHQNELCSHN